MVFGILYSPLSLLIGLVTNYISRKNEFEADSFVNENFKPVVLAEALKETLGKKPVKHDASSGLCIFSLFSSAIAEKT